MLKKLKRLTRKHRQGFTLIELLVVVLILSVLMAIAMPIYLSAVADSKLKTCRSNLQTIANAVQAARVKVRGVDYAAVIVGGVTTTNLENLHVIPLCPEAGAYSLTNGSDGDATTFRVTCSHGTHGGFEPGVDSN